jgi:hypothetical protein
MQVGAHRPALVLGIIFNTRRGAWVLRRPHPQRREAGRSSGAGSDQIRVGDQPQDREGARP